MKVSRAATQRYYKGSTLTFYHLESTCFYLFQASVIATVVIGLQGNWLISLIAVLLYLTRFIIKAIVSANRLECSNKTPLPVGYSCWSLFNPYSMDMSVFTGFSEVGRIIRSGWRINNDEHSHRISLLPPLWEVLPPLIAGRLG